MNADAAVDTIAESHMLVAVGAIDCDVLGIGEDGWIAVGGMKDTSTMLSGFIGQPCTMVSAITSRPAVAVIRMIGHVPDRGCDRAQAGVDPAIISTRKVAWM
jgi:hypothetical protein